VYRTARVWWSKCSGAGLLLSRASLASTRPSFWMAPQRGWPWWWGAVSPMAPRRPCIEPRCPGFAIPGRARCGAHQRAAWRAANAAKPPELLAFYASSVWKALSRAHRLQNPWCSLCASEGRSTPAVQVDHIVGIRQAPDRALDPENLQSLCMSCHNRKTFAEGRR